MPTASLNVYKRKDDKLKLFIMSLTKPTHFALSL